MTTTGGTFPIEDSVGAWLPHGRFVVGGSADGPLADVRFAAKDLFDVAGHTTGAGNPTWLATHAPAERHAATVAALLAAGATLMGKVLTDELAYSLHGDNAHYGAPVNTRAPHRVTGGSSSGSAAAVAAGLVDAALGTDTGGSTRVPASYCGLWGLRSTHGLLARDGLVGLSPSFDTVTWLARESDVFERVGRVLLPASGWRPTRLLALDDAAALAAPVFAEPLARVLAAAQSLLGTPVLHLAVAGAASLDDWRLTYQRASAVEAWAEHGAWITAHRPTFGAAIAARFAAARAVDPGEAQRARDALPQLRALIRQRLGDDGVAVLPSAASLAPRRDADAADVDAIRQRTMAITCIAGLAGLPQVSLPFADPEGVPLGISLLGPAGSDLALIGLARALAAACSR